MKYKLINITTKKETICDKVTIDGFDYYLSDEIIEKGWEGIAYKNDVKDKIFKHFYTTNEWYKDAKKVIATNNSNIDIPKVVDEVEKLASEFAFCYPGSQSEEEYDSKLMGYYYGYNKYQETHPFSEGDMVEFFEWCNYPMYRSPNELSFRSRVQPQFPEYNTYIVIDETGYSIHPQGVYLTTKELLQIWKEQRPKTLYYE